MTGRTRRFAFAPAAALALAFALAAGLAGVGCGKERDDRAVRRDDGPPAISEAEANRARAACEGYRERVCALAADDPSHEADCRQADSRLEALDLQFAVLVAQGDMASEDRRVVQAGVRKVAKGCLEDLAQLEVR